MKSEHAGKPIYFPEYDSFDQFFEAAAPWVHNQKGVHHSPGQWGDYLARSRSGQTSLSVKPTAEVLAKIQERMIPIDYDRKYYEIVDHPDTGCSLVIAKYNQILGSHYLGYIKTETIPHQLTQ